MSTDPNEIGGISVTIKGDEPGGKFNDAKSPGTWIVFHGTPAKVKEQIVEVFAMDAAALERPLYEVANDATALFKAAANVKTTLDGKVLNPGPQAAGNATAAPSGDVWAQANAARNSSSAPAEAVDPLLVSIENCKTVAELQQLWAENQAAFGDAKYMDPYRIKGKALSSN